MAKKEQMKKALKRLEKELDKAQRKERKTKKKLDKVKEIVRKQNKKLRKWKAKEKRRITDRESIQTSAQDSEITQSSIVQSQRAAWKRHAYLRSRYEAYLQVGENKSDARVMANSDLKKQFGNEPGYSESELNEILS